MGFTSTAPSELAKSPAIYDESNTVIDEADKENITMKFKDLRRDYLSPELRRHQLADNPFDQFHRWFAEAQAANILEANALSLATVSPEGKPSCRTVLMKDFTEQGLTFFTSYQSRKAIQLETTPYAAAVFLWKELERQVEIEGEVEKVSRQETEAYFTSRPRGNQLSAWASPQSTVIASRQVLEEAYAEVENRFAGKEIPLPPSWGGFRLRPCRFEFWQGRSNRLHDRFCYLLKEGAWQISRLAP